MLLGFVLCVLWCGLLIRTWACCSESGQPRPCTGQAARVRNRRPACGTGGPRVKEGVQPYTRLAAMRASSLCGAWAFSSARGPAVPSLGNPAHVRDRRPACGIGGPRAGHVGVQVVLSRCPWAAARPRDRHTRACGSEWSISKPGQALPPPPGTDSVPEYRSRPFCSLRNLAGVVVACAKQPQCLTGVESQNDRKCAGDESFHAR